MTLNMKRRPVSLVLWGCVVLSLIAVGLLVMFKPVKEPESVETVVNRILVRVLPIAAQTVPDVVTLPGRVLANVSATLAVEKAGRIEEVAVDQGDSVTKGQLLLRIDNRLWVHQQRQAMLALEEADRDFSRWQPMHTNGAVSSSEFDAIRHRRDQAAVAADQAAVHVQQCLLFSPFDGVVDRRAVEQGEYVTEGQAVFDVLQLQPLKVQVFISERDVASLQPGMALGGVAPSLGGAVFEGRLTFLAQEAQPDRYTYAMELTLDSPPAGLRPGMIVDVQIGRGQRSGVIAIPLAAVIPRRGEHVVYVVRDGVAVRRVVVLDAIIGQNALIRDGLQEGDLLVIEGHRGLQDGVRVGIEANTGSNRVDSPDKE
ncbi:MAG TPA: hypothetical protein DCS43_02910 [Verrucomicrobia bacterium]|nr:hypothetical protein [Verrucomicrobiota bacterium]